MTVPVQNLEWPIQCSVCLDEITLAGRGEEAAVRGHDPYQMYARARVCTHIFHKECLKPWLEDATHYPTCPTCRGGPFSTIRVLHDNSIEPITRQRDRFSDEQYFIVRGVSGEDVVSAVFVTALVVSTFVLNFLYVEIGLSLLGGLVIGAMAGTLSLACYNTCIF